MALADRKKNKDNSKYFGGQYCFCFIHKWLLVNSRWNESIWKCSMSNATLDNISMASKFQVGQWGMAYRNRSYDRLNLNLHKIEDSSWALIEADMFIMFCLYFSAFAKQDHLCSLNFSGKHLLHWDQCILTALKWSSFSGDTSQATSWRSPWRLLRKTSIDTFLSWIKNGLEQVRSFVPTSFHSTSTHFFTLWFTSPLEMEEPREWERQRERTHEWRQ